jgi:hypothetical protein
MAAMSNEFKDWYNDFSEEQKKNYELCMKYPILTPSYDSTIQSDYQYEYTVLDDMPNGWRIAFGEQWAADIQNAVYKLTFEELGKTWITEIKEKYGQLTTYFSYYSKDICEVIDKYTELSKNTCIVCGADVSRSSVMRDYPLCKKCARSWC